MTAPQRDRAGVRSGPPEPAPGEAREGFISYSRTDVARVVAVTDRIAELGRTLWFDSADIAPGSFWREELRSAIEAADAVICFVSPSWVASPECRAELDLAVTLGKRLVPVVLGPVDLALLPGELRAVQWIATAERDDYATAEAVIAALDVDTERVRDHTFWLAQALRWDAADRNRSALARGRALRAAEAWLQQGGRDPVPTPLQIAFIAAGRRAERRRGRIQLTLAVVAVVIASTLAGLAVWQRNTAVRQRDIARSQALAASSADQLSRDPQLSLLLARAGWQSAHTAEALSALRAAVHQSLVRQTMHSASGDESVMGTDHVIVGAGADGLLTSWSATSGRVIGRLELGARLLRLYPDRSGRTALALLRNGHAVVVRVDAAGGLSTGAAMPAGVVTAAISSGGRAAVVGQADGTVRRSLDGGPFTPLLQVSRDEQPTALAVSADGTVVGVGTGLRAYRQQLPRPGTVEGRLYMHTTRGTRMMRTALTPMAAVRLDDRGDTVLASAEDGAGFVDRIGPDVQLMTIKNAFRVDLAPNGRFAVLSTLEGATQLGTVSDGRWRTLAQRSSLLADLRFSADGTLVVGVSINGPGYVWATPGGGSLAQLLGAGAASSVFVSADDRTVVTGHPNGNANVWAVPAVPHRISLGNPDQNVTVGIEVNSIDISPDGGYVLISADDGVIRTWSPDGARRCLAHGPTSELGYCPLALAVVARIGAPALGLSALARFSPDGHQVAVEASDGSVWAFATTTIPRLLWHAAAVGTPATASTLAYSPDGHQLLAQRGGSAPRLLATTTGRVTATLPVSAPQDALGAWLSSHEIVICDATGKVTVYTDAGRLVRTVTDVGSPAFALAASPDGRSVAVSSGPDIAVFDATTGARQVTLSGHTQNVDALTYSTDGAFLLSGSLDGTARLWDPSTATTLTTIAAAGSQIDAVALDSVTHTILAAGRDSAVYVSPCDICLGQSQLAQLAARRSTRPLTAVERSQFAVGSLLANRSSS